VKLAMKINHKHGHKHKFLTVNKIIIIIITVIINNFYSTSNRRWEDNIKMDLGEIVWSSKDLIHLV
jgi:hypothetical protein